MLSGDGKGTQLAAVPADALDHVVHLGHFRQPVIDRWEVAGGDQLGQHGVPRCTCPWRPSHRPPVPRARTPRRPTRSPPTAAGPPARPAARKLDSVSYLTSYADSLLFGAASAHPITAHGLVPELLETPVVAPSWVVRHRPRMETGNLDLRSRLQGCYVTLPTMFRDDAGLSVDLDAMHRHVRFLIDGGITTGTGVLLAGGAAGDFSTMTFDERVAVTEAVVAEADGRVPVVMGGQTTSTRGAGAAGAEGGRHRRRVRAGLAAVLLRAHRRRLPRLRCRRRRERPTSA